MSAGIYETAVLVMLNKRVGSDDAATLSAHATDAIALEILNVAHEADRLIASIGEITKWLTEKMTQYSALLVEGCPVACPAGSSLVADLAREDVKFHATRDKLLFAVRLAYGPSSSVAVRDEVVRLYAARSGK